MADPATSPQLVNVQINGVWHQFPKGTRLIEACEQAGSYVPRYCYHKKLTAPGNCRMCLIEMGLPKMGPDRKPELGADGKPLINWMPRPQISCAQEVSEGMGSGRTHLGPGMPQSVMEFLLINHPLDCPICDQAGECRLQEFSVEYGTAGHASSKTSEKTEEHRAGPRVTPTTSVAFSARAASVCQEIAHESPGVRRSRQPQRWTLIRKRLENNVRSTRLTSVGGRVDLIRLSVSDARLFLKETQSFCTSCATGCNTLIGTREDVIYRQTPRETTPLIPAGCALRASEFRILQSEKRLLQPEILPAKTHCAEWSVAITQRRFS